MRTSPVGLKLIKEFEGYSPVVYHDAVGLRTIGYGHLVRPGEKFTSLTETEALALLALDVADAEWAVERHVTDLLTQNEFDALVSFVFNVGPGRAGRDGKDGFVTLKTGKPSTMLRKLNSGDWPGAADEFLKWNRAGGKVLAGLTKRREAERKMFIGER